MKTLLIATNNAHKVREIGSVLRDAGMEDIALTDLTAYPNYVAPEENGATFAENARIKAVAAARYTGHLALADDSGLTVEALGGAPGIFSARYAGKEQLDAANNAKLLAKMAQVPPGQRQAAFCCVIALAKPNGQFWLAEGRVEGMILETPQGNGGFGYDPLFYLPPYGQTMAELSPQEKNRISHRALALQKALPILRQEV